MNILNSTEPHFIRAIKPNEEKKPDMFDAPDVVRQLKYAGLLETIRIRSAGYSLRPTFQEFFTQFKILVPSIQEKTKNKSPREACEELLLQLGVDKTKMQIGISKLFFKEKQVHYTIHIKLFPLIFFFLFSQKV